ncbi:MAG: hypothetical protein LKM37_05355 [Bacteroidales bacterium]|jgi:hypothetical protein|nr:hypothetical protein [Bacteroidales bacterium]MCI1733933.1 hypothetical protein [Bacteroidales bacterium]
MKKINGALGLLLTIIICVSASCSKDDIKDYSNLGPNKIFYGANKIMSVNTTIDCSSLNKILTSTIWYGRYTTSFNINSKGIIDFVDVCIDMNRVDNPAVSYYKFVGKDSVYLYRVVPSEYKRYDLSCSVDSNSKILSFFYKGKAVMEWKLVGLEDGTIAVNGDDFAFHGRLTTRKYSEIRTVYRPFTEHFSNVGKTESVSYAKEIMSKALPVDVWNSKYPPYPAWTESWE